MRLDAILLAAGAARRFGACKLTASFEGRPLMAGALDAALEAPVQEVVLVTGQHGEAVSACARSLHPAAVASGRLRLVEAPHAANGLGASLSAGISQVAAAEGVFVFLADMPAVPKDMAWRLAARLAQGIDAVAPVWRGQRGHPVLFARSLRPALLALRDDEGARAVLSGLSSSLALVEAPDDGVLLDVDTPRDLQTAGARRNIQMQEAADV